MKKFFWIFLIFSSITFAKQYYPTGGVMLAQKTNHQIYLGCYGYILEKCHKATFIYFDGNEETIINPHLVFIFDESVDQFQRRWYGYNWLKMTAATLLNPIPYTAYIINMQRASQKYLEAFKLMDRNNDESDIVKLKDSYFMAMKKAIEQLELD